MVVAEEEVSETAVVPCSMKTSLCRGSLLDQGLAEGLG